MKLSERSADPSTKHKFRLQSSIIIIPQQEVKAELDNPPDIEKVKMAVRKRNIHKVPVLTVS